MPVTYISELIRLFEYEVSVFHITATLSQLWPTYNVTFSRHNNGSAVITLGSYSPATICLKFSFGFKCVISVLVYNYWFSFKLRCSYKVFRSVQYIVMCWLRSYGTMSVFLNLKLNLFNTRKYINKQNYNLRTCQSIYSMINIVNQGHLDP